MERETTSSEATRFGSSQPSIAKSVGTGEEATRKQPSAETIALNKARKEKGAEVAVKPDDLTADAGDAG
jgi:hypothetical protein